MKAYVQRDNKIIREYTIDKDEVEDFIEFYKKKTIYLFHHVEDEWVEVYVK